MLLESIAAVLLILVGLLHLLPGTVALSANRARAAYGVTVDGPDLEVLLRHRAILLALVGAGLIVAAFAESVRAPALTAAVISLVSFILIATTTGPLNPKTRRVLNLDLAALAALAIAIVLYVIER
ncbi:hypothetical protein [Nocardia sp. NPDC057668]|uniref:hypothetical protein n=1 Tax=Nocardia sp. NPDC057668 TaxID=3346202 RepID=UPI00366CAD87